jgi:hypothetical protein
MEDQEVLVVNQHTRLPTGIVDDWMTTIATMMKMSRCLSLFSLLLMISNDIGVDALATSTKSGASGGGFGAGSQSKIVHTPDTTETTQKLLQFLTAQNSKGLKDVEIGYAPNGVRGLFCTKNFKKGKMMCQIPSDVALALSDPSKNGEDAPTLSHGGSNFLSMYWKNEEAKKLWAPYLDTLPAQGSAQFDPTPDFFETEELELLEFPRLIRQATDRKEQIATVAAEKGIDVEELRFATWLTASRAFRISISAESTDNDENEEGEEEPKLDDRGQIITKAGEEKDIRVMVPFIDMANHSSDQPNAKLTLIDPEKDDAWFALEATRPIAAGKEIVIAYGNGIESSVELLLNYGFVPQSNKIDGFMLKKGGDECITSLAGWTTTLDEDKAMLSMSEDDNTLQKILSFRIRLKESYNSAE